MSTCCGGPMILSSVGVGNEAVMESAIGAPVVVSTMMSYFVILDCHSALLNTMVISMLSEQTELNNECCWHYYTT